MARQLNGKGKGKKGAAAPAAEPKEERSELVNVGARSERIQHGFEEIYNPDREIAAQAERHLKTLKESRTKAWRNLKADTGIDREDLKNHFALYARERFAKEEMEEEDRDRIIDNLREVHNAMATGGMVDFIKVLEGTGRSEQTAADDETVPASAEAGSPDAAERQGYEDSKAGRVLSRACPFEEGTEEHARYIVGWKKGQAKNAEGLKRPRSAPAETATAH